MEKKKTTAKLKRKGAYLSSPDQESTSSAESMPAADQNLSSRPIKTTTYKRKRYQHWFRMISFLILIFLDVSIVGTAIRSHLWNHVEITNVKLLREFFLYVILACLNCIILPSVVMEANEVEVTTEHITFRNLLFAQTVSWSDINGIFAPIYLKFAVIKLPGSFQLINRRDIANFEQLFQTIKTKTDLQE
jgi:hypothetical protein